jgi:hypothetical protein
LYLGAADALVPFYPDIAELSEGKNESFLVIKTLRACCWTRDAWLCDDQGWVNFVTFTPHDASGEGQ